jgi:ribonuclease BN (tRNA processing enzyme)
MSGLRLIPLGVGDAFSARYYSSCLALESSDTWLLIDCPHPIRKMMREAGATADAQIEIERISGVVLTHLHADHSSGLEGFAYYGYFVLGRRMPLLVHPEVSFRLWEGHLAAGMEQLLRQQGEPPCHMRLEDYFDLIPLDTARPVAFGPFQVECRPTNHGIPTMALRVRTADRCLGYSADTAFDPGLIEWLSSADLIIHETNLGPVHTPYEELARLPAGLRAKMRLIHFPDTFDCEAANIELLEQGRSYAV